MTGQEQLLMQNYQAPRRPLSMNPRKFILWLFIVSISMLFAALTSAYMVRKSEGNWLNVEMPTLFWISSAIILISSLTMHLAVRSAGKDDFSKLKTWISLTLVLGLGFLITQYMGWSELVTSNVYFVGNPAGSFVYVFSGLHGLHIVSGIVFLAIIFYLVLAQKVHSKNMNSVQMCATFWHFLDGLWLYLFTFLLLNH